MTLNRDDDTRLAEEDARQADLDVEARSADDAEDEDLEVAEIRTEIEETRLEMGGTLNELGTRLDPGNLMNEAKENVREATVGRVEETAKGMSNMVMDTIKRNPIPSAMAGAGLALLWMNRSDESGNGNDAKRSGSRYDPYYGTTSSYGQRRMSAGEGDDSGQGIGDRAGQVVGGAGDTVGQVVGEAGERVGQVGGEVIERGQQTAQEVGWRLERFMQASPLAVGAIAVGAGALVGALVPETEQERELLGDASRQVGDTVREAVGEAGQQAERSIDEAERSMA